MKKYIFILSIICVVCLCSCFNFHTGTVYVNADRYTAGSFSYRAGDVDRVCISYVSGDVTVVQTDNRTLGVTETGNGLSEAQEMHWYLDGRTLRIQFCKSGYTGKMPSNSKKLTVEIPYGIELEVGVTSGDVTFATDIEVMKADFGATSGDYKVKAVRTSSFNFGATSGSVTMDALYADKANFGSTSGNTAVSLIQAEKISFGSTSGSTKLSGIRASKVNGGSTSGNITLSFEYCENLDIGCTSGNVRITKLPENGASIKYDKTSGTLKADGYMVKNNWMVFGDGGCSMTIDTTSGNLIIEK